MRIVFMGTPDFAVPCLRALLAEPDFTVCGVFTQPDKPKGRKQILTAPPVKELALENGLPVYQPATLRSEEAAQRIADLKPDVIAVAAYGKILPKAILELPPMGCVNVHGSLLPKYRGAAPIQWSVINGDAVSGVTTMQMAEGMDTGDMLLREETKIRPEETGGTLFDRLSEMGARLLVRTLRGLAAGEIHPVPQPEAEATYAPMLKKETGEIHWEKSAREIDCLVRGLNPWPVAWTTIDGKRLKVYRVCLRGETGPCGKAENKDGAFLVYCGDGALELAEIQAENGKRMSGADYLRGHPISGMLSLGEGAAE